MKNIFINTPIFPALFFSMIILGCNPKNTDNAEGSSSESTPPTPTMTVPKFDTDSAYHYIQKQVDFGPRAPGTESHAACKEWLASKLESFGAEVTIQNFMQKVYTGEEFEGANIIGSFNPDHPKRILLTAHWDTRPFADQDMRKELMDKPIPGADDGGSGVGVLLEIARLLHQNPVGLGVDIVLFDLEDYGHDTRNPNTDLSQTWCLGSQHWSRNPHKPGYNAEFGILLDMVGSKKARFPKEQYSVKFADDVVEKVWKQAKDMGYGNFFVNDFSASPVTDDHYYINTIARIPTIDIINKPQESRTGFGNYWHTHEDNMSIISERTLRAVGRVVLAVIYEEAQAM